MKGIIEGLLYVQGDLGLTIEQVSNILEITNEESKQLILSLKQDYIDQNRGLRINYLGNSFKLTTKEEHKEYFKKLLENPKNNKEMNGCIEIKYNDSISQYTYKYNDESCDKFVTNEKHGIIYSYSDNNLEKQEKIDKVVDDLKQKYGYNSITRAGKLHSEDKIKLKDM